MPRTASLPPPDSFVTFGALLRFLRRRAGLTQAELAASVGYSEAQISRLEHNRRGPEPTVLRARFLPALQCEDLASYQPRLLALAEAMREAGAGEIPAPPHAAGLIGRANEHAALAGLLEGGKRLVTVTGPPGVGKTSLARQVAQSVATRFPGGVTFVDLTAITEPALVLAAIAQTLHVEIKQHRDYVRAFIEAMPARPTLFVLDNFEQVLAAAPQLKALLAAAPQLALLVTSRAPLNLPGEHRFALAPLALPPDHTAAPDTLATVDSVALLVNRLRQANHAFRLDEANAATLAAICIEVDGLPLAIELVAAHGRLLSARDLLDHVARQHHRLVRRSMDHTTHHDSLIRTLEWSLALLPPAAQHLFARLALFVGGWTFEAAEAICGADTPALLESLEILLDHSLVQQHRHNERTRFSMLVTVRAFAAERLAASDEWAELRRRHAAHFLTVAEQAERELVGPHQKEWHDRITDDLENMRAALAWACEHDLKLGLRLASALDFFWYMRGYGFEGRRWLEQLLFKTPDHTPDAVLAAALMIAGILAYHASDYKKSADRLQRSLWHYHMLEDDQNIARVQNNLGIVAMDQGQYEEARQQYQASLALRRTIGYTTGIASSLNNLAEVTRLQGDFNQARVYYAESLSLYQQIGDTWSIASVLSNTATVAYQQGMYDDARMLYEESLVIREDLGDQPGRAHVLNGLGNVARACGDEQRAEMLYQESLGLHSAMLSATSLAEALIGLARLAAPNDPERAARLLGAASAQMERHGIKVDQYISDDYDRVRSAASTQLGERRCAVVWQAGRALSHEQAITYALGEGMALREG